MAENFLSELYIDHPYGYAYYTPDHPVEDSFINFIEEANKQAAFALGANIDDKIVFKRTEERLQELAEESLINEKAFYTTVFKEEASAFNEQVDIGFETKDPAYMLKQTYNGQPLYQALTYKLLDINDSNDTTGKWEFIQILSSLRSQDITSGLAGVELSPIEQAKEIIDGYVKSFAYTMKEHRFNLKAQAPDLAEDQRKKLIEQAYHERFLFDMDLRKTDIKIKPKDVQDFAIGIPAPDNMELYRSSGSKDVQIAFLKRHALKQKEMIQEIISLLGPLIKESLTEEEIEDVLYSILEEGKPISSVGSINTKTNIVTSAGINKKFSAFMSPDGEGYKKLESIIQSEISTTSGAEKEVEITFKKELDEQLRSKLKNFHQNVYTFINNWNRPSLTRGITMEDFKQRASNYYTLSLRAYVDEALENDYHNIVQNELARSELYDELKALTTTLTQIKTLADAREIANQAKKKTEEQLQEIISAATKDGKVKLGGKEYKPEDVLQKLKDPKEVEVLLGALSTRITERVTGFVSNVQGSIGELIYTVLLRQTVGETNAYQFGRARNEKGQQAHADIGFVIDNNLYGIQSKVYQSNNATIYEKTTVNFASSDAIRYLGSEDALTAFRFFLVNNSVLESPLVNVPPAVSENGEVSFLKILYDKLDYFIRYSDGLTSLENVHNTFYMINFNLIPASAVFFLIMQQLEIENNNKNSKKFIDYTPDKISLTESQVKGEDGKNKNLMNKDILKFIENKATFKGLTINLNSLGAIFNKG